MDWFRENHGTSPSDVPWFLPSNHGVYPNPRLCESVTMGPGAKKVLDPVPFFEAKVLLMSGATSLAIISSKMVTASSHP
jgi:hypothetical protein